MYFDSFNGFLIPLPEEILRTVFTVWQIYLPLKTLSLEWKVPGTKEDKITDTLKSILFKVTFMFITFSDVMLEFNKV